MPKDRHYPVRPRKGGKRLKRRKGGIAAPLLLVGVLALAAVWAEKVGGVDETEAQRVSVQAVEMVGAKVFCLEPDAWIGEDPCEAEKIEQALVEQGYFRYDVPLSMDEQDFLHTACQEAGIPYALALAVIQQETGFRNVVGDDGASTGYMQVQEKWHWDRMERLGVDDLNHPFGNFRVGCDFLAELLEKYPVEEALTAYNRGTPGESGYSQEVMENYEAWKELVGNDVSGIKG